MSVDAAGLGSTALGAVFLYAGIKGISVGAALTSIVKGTNPATLAQTAPITGSPATAAAAAGSTAAAGSASYDSSSALQKLWTGNGGPADTAAFAAAIAEAESGGSATVTSANPDGGTNVGVFQLDTRGVGSGYSVAQLQDANLNTQITIMATGGGTNWEEWGDPVSAAVGGHYTPGTAIP